MTDDDRNYLKALDEVRAERDAALARAEAAEARCATLEAALVTVRDWIRDGKGTESEAAEAMDAALSATHPARCARIATLEAALRHLARSDSWEIVGDAENNIEECGLMLKEHDTPWMFARAALAAATPPAEEDC